MIVTGKQKPIFAAFTALLLLLLPSVSRAQDFTYATNDGTITITGYTGTDTVVTIPDAIDGLPVTSIGNYAFQNQGGLISVTIPDSATNIGSYAFDYCTNLANVTIGTSVTSLGEFAFWGCTSLTNVTIPNSVTSFENYAFSACTGLTGITIPSSVTRIADFAFYYCNNLMRVHFKGNAPTVGSLVFDGDNNLTIYFLPGTTGWGSTFADRPTALWQPMVQTSDASFGVRTNQFGFNISWVDDLVVVVEATEDVVNPIWTPLGTNILTGGSSYFSDPQWTNYPGRFYRIRLP